MITTITVTSLDGVQFSVSFYSRNENQALIAARGEKNFAATRYAHQLDSFGDYHRVDPLSGYVVAPEPAPKLPLSQLVPSYAETPRIAGPAERRAAFTVIKGGKQP